MHSQRDKATTERGAWFSVSLSAGGLFTYSNRLFLGRFYRDPVLRDALCMHNALVLFQQTPTAHNLLQDKDA